MCNKDLLVSYLYEDLGTADTLAFEAHLRACDACREELDALRGVRVDLSTWAPPLPELGFRIVRDAKRAPSPLARAGAWRAWWTPAAGLAAAAVLVLAAASAIAHVEIHRGPDGITVRTGWSASAPASGRSLGETGARDVRLSAPGTGADFVSALEKRIAALENAVRGASAVRNASTLSARSSDAELVKRVREMVAQSETRQQGELALRLAQVIRDFDAQRTADLANIQRGFRNIEAMTTNEIAAHRDLANYVFTNAKQK